MLPKTAACRILGNMSSSNRDPQQVWSQVRRGLVYQGERIVGGVHLPAEMSAFVEHFNREYAAAGLQLVPATHPTPPVVLTGSQ
jgi:hypothetical protein